MKNRSSVLKTILKGLFYILLVLIVTELLIYFMVPVYEFPAPKPFSGDKYYNPYAGCDQALWKKANFHYHNRAWGGITNGRKNNYQDFYRIYKTMLGYDAPQISNYQRIDRHYQDSSFYIPCYEHGFGIRKKHQLLIGARDVLWLDYSLYQNVNHKQHILNMLRDQSDIVAIAHPDWDHGYTAENLKLLTNYDLLEVLDENWRSVPLWDAALSAGHPVFIVADDDAHDLGNPMQIGTCCTFIYSAEVSRAALTKSLKDGKAFGADIYNDGGETFESKAEKAKHFGTLEYAEMKGDTLRVKTSLEPMKFTFIGQNGQVRQVSRGSDSAFYVFRQDDSYIRTEIQFYNRTQGPGTIYYLNPVFRYSGERPDNSLKAEVDWIRTWIFRLFSIPSLFVLIILVVWSRWKKATLKQNQDGG